MKIIDALGKPCPIPVIETKKALAEQDVSSVLVKVDNIVAVQNLEKMATGNGYGFSYKEEGRDLFDIFISKDGKATPDTIARIGSNLGGIGVVISRDTMGKGAEELGKILIKGFIYSLTELPAKPEFVVFLNSGVRLTSEGSNTINDLKKLAQKGTQIFSCGTCVNYYGLQDKLAVGEITDMYNITEKMSAALKVVNI